MFLPMAYLTELISDVPLVPSGTETTEGFVTQGISIEE
jgi:hypothetical protein